MKQKSKPVAFVPAYARLPLLLVLGIQLLSYYLPKWITRDLPHYHIALPIDRAIPVVPAFTVFYLLAFVQWIVGYLAVARYGRTLCFQIASGAILAELLCMVVFLLVPTSMRRPPVASDDLLCLLTRLIYSNDTPSNLFPSQHCMQSWICFRAAQKMDGHRRFAVGNLLLTLLVFASTVLVKQHVVIDIVGGVLVAELGLYLAKVTNAASVLRRLEVRRRALSLSSGEHP